MNHNTIDTLLKAADCQAEMGARGILRDLEVGHMGAADLAADLRHDGEVGLAMLLDPSPMIDDLLQLPEFGPVDYDDRRTRQSGVSGYGDKIRLVWRLNSWKSAGRAVLGAAKKLSKKERELSPHGPWWEITLALPYWLTASEDERRRLVHHELMHLYVLGGGTPRAEPDLRTHDMMEFASTIARFGVLDQLQADVVAHARVRPEADLIAYGYDHRGQGILFGADPVVSPPVLDTVERVPIAEPPAPKVMAMPAPEEDGWKTFARQCRQVAREAEELPERCDAAGSWVDSLEGMAEEADEHEHVTGPMWEALQNISEGIDKWAR